MNTYAYPVARFSRDRQTRDSRRSSRRPGIAIEVVIDAPVAFVWSQVHDIANYVDWIQDTEEIRFLTDRHSGVGTRFECKTFVGPFRMANVIEITNWKHTQAIEVHHQGIVSGTGEFRLRASGSNTILSWVEQLTFPWYFAGPLGAMAARPILKSLWKGNLRRLKTRIESGYAKERYPNWGTQ